MTKKPTFIVHVSDLERSTHFYRLALGLEVRSVDDAIAVLEPESWPVLLAGQDAGDVSPHLADVHETVKPHATIHRFSPDLDGLYRRLLGFDLDPVLHATSWGDRTLTIDDPDGYEVSFWTTSNRTSEQTIDLYASGPDLLDEALASLSDDDLDWKPSADEWSIREIVHHIVDTDTMALSPVKMALAEPGSVVEGNPYRPETWVRSLDYAGREVAPAVSLLRANRKHILQILHHVPDALERYIQNPEGESTTVETFISMLASHLMIHIEQIQENQRIRSLQGA